MKTNLREQLTRCRVHLMWTIHLSLQTIIKIKRLFQIIQLETLACLYNFLFQSRGQEIHPNSQKSIFSWPANSHLTKSNPTFFSLNLVQLETLHYESKTSLAFYVDFKRGEALKIETFLMVTDTTFMERRWQKINKGRR